MGIKTEPKILFGPGKFLAEGGAWVEKTEADCAEMVLNFNELAARGEYPNVTLGHPNDTAAPKFGELHEAWWDPAGNCIAGPLDDLNPELAEAIETGAFDKVSIVFCDNWWDPVAGRHRNNVITEVGVLGAKWGAFKQPDKLTIARSMSEAGGKGAKVYRLSMADMEEAPDNGGGEDVEDKERKELLAKIEALEAENKELKATAPDDTGKNVEELQAIIDQLKADMELALKAKAAADEKIADAEVKAKEATVDEVLKDAVTADAEGSVRMTPAEAEVMKPVLMSMDSSRTIKLAEGKDGAEPVMASPLEQALAAIKARPVVLKFAEKSVTDSDDLHPGKPKVEKPELTPAERRAARGFGKTEEEYAATKAEMAKREEEE